MQKGQTADKTIAACTYRPTAFDTGAHSFVLVTSCGRCASKDGECGIQYTAQDTLVITTTV